MAHENSGKKFLSKDEATGKIGLIGSSMKELSEDGAMLSSKFRSGDLKLDFELEMMFRHSALTELAKMLSEYVLKMKDDHPAKKEFEYHIGNIIRLKIMEDVLSLELRVARQRASDAELRLLIALNDKKVDKDRQDEISVSNEEILDLYKKIEDLEKKNEELVKML